MKFNELPLHDATLLSIANEWSESSAVVNGEYFNKESGNIEKYTIKFTEVTCIDVPHFNEWGSSSQINGISCKENKLYEIEMQSGDTISFKALGFSFK